MKLATSMLASACLAFGALASPAYAADNYPSKPIRMLVGFAAGGPADAVARTLARRLQDQLGQNVVVENRTGADGNIALAAVARGEADGYTLVMTQNGVTVNPSLYRSVPFDPMADFAPIAFIGEGTNFVAVTAQLPIKTLDELIDYGKRNPGKLSYAATSSPNELAGELLAQMAGMKIEHVRYRGAAPALPDVISGRIHMMVSNISTLLPHVESGRLRALAVSGLERSPLAPEVPTVSELGLKGYSASTWYGVLAPAATPEPIVKRLHAEINSALKDPETAKQMMGHAVELNVQSIDWFKKFLADDLQKWKRVVAASGGPRD